MLVVVGLAVVTSGVSGMLGAKDGQSGAYQNLQEKVAVEKRDLKRTVAANGTLEADQQTTVVFGAGGTVTDVPVSVGQTVNKNEVLTQTAFEKLKAPFDGRVLALHVFEGGAAVPGGVAVVVGYRSSHVEFFASESEVLELSVGQAATLKFPAYQNGRNEYTGTVSFVDVQKASTQSALQSSETGYLVKVTVADLPIEVTSRLGLTADVEVEVGSADQVLSLETGAVHYDENNQPFVYRLPVIDDAFVASAATTDDVTTLLERKSISTGFEADDYLEITSGLDENDEVLLYIPQQASSSFF